ncbi:MAG: single-stranded DNA-binding protein [Eubacteriales bacterium]
MASFNKVILVGNLTADPELKQTQSGISVCHFSIAVNRRSSREDQGQPSTDFFNIVAWRQTAEFVARYFKKGRPILVSGRLQNRNWTDKDGQKRYATEVVADEVTFSDNKSDSTGGGTYTPGAYGAPAISNSPANFEEIPDDDSLPF